MIPSKVTVAPETIKGAGIMTAAHKREVRTQRIIDLIRSKPAGERILFREFAKAINVNSEVTAMYAIDKLISKGIITKHNIGLKSYSYSVNTDASITETKQGPLLINPDLKEQIDTIKSYTRPTDAEAIERLAMEYAWHADRTERNDLRKFIDYIKEKKNG